VSSDEACPGTIRICRPTVAAANALYKAAAYGGRAAPQDDLYGIESSSQTFDLDNTGAHPEVVHELVPELLPKLLPELLCVARVQTFGSTRLIRHVCTLPYARQQGLARQLCAYLGEHIRAPLYLFPLPELVALYQGAGFIQMSEHDLPDELIDVWKQAKRSTDNTQPMHYPNGELNEPFK